MARPRDTAVPGTEERPSTFSLIVIAAVVVLALIIVFAVVLPAVAWLLSLALPVGLVVLGAHLVSREQPVGASSFARVGGWVSLALGGLWLLARIGIL
jgi:hypothetical protein